MVRATTSLLVEEGEVPPIPEIPWVLPILLLSVLLLGVAVKKKKE